MKILVTGGAGCIGSDLAERVWLQGHSVTVVDDLSSGKVEHIATLLPHPRFRFIEADLLDPDTAQSVMPGVDFVHHLAANPDVKYSPGDPTDKDLRQTILVTYNVLEAMRLAGVKLFAFSSTSAVYGIAQRLPIPETDPMLPISLYIATKMGCECLISASQNLFVMRFWIFRFSNIVGPKVRKRGRTVISDFIHRLQQDSGKLLILGNGRQAKSYLTSTECVDAMLFAIERASSNLLVFNLGCDDSLTVDRIAEMVIEAMRLPRVKLKYTGTEGGWPGDVPRFKLDVTRINRLGWKAKMTSEQAVNTAIQALVPLCRP